MQLKETIAKAKVVQFEISARDPGRLAAFYDAVLGWEGELFEAGGSDVFVLEGLANDLRARIERSVGERDKLSGFECTVAVSSVQAVATRVVANGGSIIDAQPFIEGVGGLVRFADPEGNVITAMQFA